MNTCTTCGHGLHDTRATWTTCQACQDRFTQQLADIERMWPLLTDCLEPTRGHSGPRVSGSKAHAALPASEHVLDLIGPMGIAPRLYVQYATVCVARGLQPQQAAPGSDARLAQAARGLRRHLPWAVQAVDLTDVGRELSHLAEQLVNVTGGAPESPSVPCPAELPDGGRCTGKLRYDQDRGTAACRTCRTVLDPSEWLGYWVKLNPATV